MTHKMFRNETPPALTITFDTAVTGYASVLLRFFAPNDDEAILDATVTMAGDNLSGTATLTDDDLATFVDQVYYAMPVGVNGGDETALFENPVKFIVRTLPSAPGVS